MRKSAIHCIFSLLLLTALTYQCKINGNSYKDNNSDNETGLNIGDIAPDIIANSPSGVTICLSSLRGKVVLIDFWASWCSPCRKENPNLVSTYQKYKDQKFINGNGFTIYSVSLDKRKAAWESAIYSDELEWENHVSDLKGWSSEYASKYNVYAIPGNFLIDGDGVIISKNITGKKLHEELNKILE